MFVELGPFALQSHCHYPYQQRVWATMPVSFLRSLSARGAFAAAKPHGFDMILKGDHGLLVFSIYLMTRIARHLGSITERREHLSRESLI